MLCDILNEYSNLIWAGW